ncbi:Mor transcription activator family protein [Pseudomonas segetis]|uniref:Transcriptional regulator, Middle operon regulator (Mor) family n=1 Tax=Pseudomonas segetis TaxID=298908 RepID=A0A239JN94_9PSED|nr:Mor transcription activator family protein [Pseudomonas segetis]SNT07307.1 Transcriptional regulator, Middle operon regulator (Mor) family [Pseudomonas segetis]
MSHSDLFGDEMPTDALEHMQDPEIRSKWPQALADMVEVIEAAHRRAGDDEATARKRALVTVRALSRLAGGRLIYVPKGDALDRALRDRDIWQRHGGQNTVETLASDYDLTVTRVYSILAEQRALHRKRSQPSLF